jgi:PAS domain S-box-containing protein
MPAALTRCSADLRYLWVSERYARWLGLTPQEVVGKPIADVIGAGALDAIRPHIEAVLSGKTVEHEATFPLVAIGPRWIRTEYAPTFDASGAVDGWEAALVDVTDHRRHEEELDELRSRLAADLTVMTMLHDVGTRFVRGGDLSLLLEHVMDTAIAISGADLGMGNIRLRDPESGALRIVAQRGFRREFLEFFALTTEDVGSWGTAMRSLERTIVEDVTQSPIFAGTPALDVLLAAGVRAVQSTPIFTRSGALVGMLSTHYRTPRRPSEHELGLLDLVARQLADLVERTRIEEELRQANQRKDEFLAMLGHELRNPLAPILMATDLMRQRPAHAESARTVIERQAKHLARMVDDLLDVSRITRGSVVLRKTRVDLAEIVAEAIEMVKPLIEERSHEVSVDVPRGVLHVDADPARLVQVVGNLLTNAARYTSPGGKIAVAGQTRDGAVVLRVRDTGIGISPAILPRVFDLFVQEKQASDRSSGGLGLGLAIVRSLVQLHGGGVSAHSEGVGQGSAFVITLPLAGRGAESPLPRPAVEETHTRAGTRVLVVEDNQDGAWMLGASLEELGHEVRVARDGPAALELVREFSPNVALLDIGLPAMDGYELARRLRQVPGLSGLALVAVTGYGQDTDRRRAHEAGFDAHLVKPATMDEVQAVVRRLVDAAASTRRAWSSRSLD